MPIRLHHTDTIYYEALCYQNFGFDPEILQIILDLPYLLGGWPALAFNAPGLDSLMLAFQWYPDPHPHVSRAPEYSLTLGALPHQKKAIYTLSENFVDLRHGLIGPDMISDCNLNNLGPIRHSQNLHRPYTLYQAVLEMNL